MNRFFDVLPDEILRNYSRDPIKMSSKTALMKTPAETILLDSSFVSDDKQFLSTPNDDTILEKLFKKRFFPYFPCDTKQPSEAECFDFPNDDYDSSQFLKRHRSISQKVKGNLPMFLFLFLIFKAIDPLQCTCSNLFKKGTIILRTFPKKFVIEKLESLGELSTFDTIQ